MAWQQLNYGVWFTSLGPLARNWWLGWSSVGGFRLFRSDREEASAAPKQTGGLATPQIRVRRHQQEGWVDYFLGQADVESRQRCSVIDAHQKLALHYLKSDLPQLHQLDCPSEEIPSHLWQKLAARASEWS